MAGEPTARITKSAIIGGLTIGGTVATVSADTIIAFQKTFPIGTNVEADINLIVVANAVLLSIESSADATVKTNSTGSPTDTLNLKAGQPLIWQTNDPAGAKFLSGDVTKIYVTNTAVTTLKIGVLQDTTPVL
jgi:hypothetical protein